MLSILIPTRNDDCQLLVTELLEQREELQTDFEIIIFDDASTDVSILEANRGFGDFNNVCVLESEVNVGRLAARLKLANEAKNEWLLFLDADVIPKDFNFLKSYCEATSQRNDVIFGGIAYGSKPLEKEHLLHWYYGKQREERSLQARLKKPLQTLVSANIAIRKTVFLKLENTDSHAIYGSDEMLLIAMLKAYKKKVSHIDNAVFHLGLEETPEFINKQLLAVNALALLAKEHKDLTIERPLLRAYKNLNMFGMSSIFLKVVGKFLSKIERNLRSSKPSLRMLDIYKLYHFTKLQ